MEKEKFFSWKVSSLEKGMRLILFIKNKTKTNLSSRFIKKTVEKGICRVNGKVECFSSVVLKEGDVVQLYKNFEKLFLEKKIFPPFKILYEDEFFKIIDKRAFFISVENEVDKFFEDKIYLVHRLDRETTGVLILVKSLEMKKKMMELFLKRKIKKTYLAVVDGRVNKKKGRVECFLKKRENFGKVLWCPSSRGLFSLTYFERLKVKKDFSVLKCFPITGRTHQIRAHMLKLNHPILGDYQYGSKLFLNSKFFIPRLMLHSLKVEFVHPILKKELKIKAGLPSFFEKFVL